MVKKKIKIRREPFWQEDYLQDGNLEDIYDSEYATELLDDDEISAEEEAFMVGYNSV